MRRESIRIIFKSFFFADENETIKKRQVDFVFQIFHRTNFVWLSNSRNFVEIYENFSDYFICNQNEATDVQIIDWSVKDWNRERIQLWFY